MLNSLLIQLLRWACIDTTKPKIAYLLLTEAYERLYIPPDQMSAWESKTKRIVQQASINR